MLVAAERANIIFHALSVTDNDGLMTSGPYRFESTIHIDLAAGAPPSAPLLVGISVLPPLSDGNCSSITGLYGHAKAQTEIAAGDRIISIDGARVLEHGSMSSVVTDQPGIVTIIVERHSVDPGRLTFQVGRRKVCKDIFQHRYPVSQSTFKRIMFSKLNDAGSVYELRAPAPKDHDTTRGLRGQICVSWLMKYAEHNSERLPDISMRLLPCVSLKVCHSTT